MNDDVKTGLDSVSRDLLIDLIASNYNVDPLELKKFAKYERAQLEQVAKYILTAKKDGREVVSFSPGGVITKRADKDFAQGGVITKRIDKEYDVNKGFADEVREQIQILKDVPKEMYLVTVYGEPVKIFMHKEEAIKFMDRQLEISTSNDADVDVVTLPFQMHDHESHGQRY